MCKVKTKNYTQRIKHRNDTALQNSTADPQNKTSSSQNV